MSFSICAALHYDRAEYVRRRRHLEVGIVTCASSASKKRLFHRMARFDVTDFAWSVIHRRCQQTARRSAGCPLSRRIHSSDHSASLVGSDSWHLSGEET